MTDPKKLLSTTTSSSLLKTTNSLLNPKPTILNDSTSSSALKTTGSLTSTRLGSTTSSSLLPSSILNKPSTLITSKTSSNLFNSNIGASFTNNTLANSTLLKSSPSALGTTLANPATKFSFSSASSSIPTQNSLLTSKPQPTGSALHSTTTNIPTTLTSESSLNRKRKIETNESISLISSNLEEKYTSPSTSTDVSSSSTAFVYKNENIPPLQASINLNIELHSSLPAPKRPRIDPFHSISNSLENQNFKDEDANVGIKSIKKSFLNSLADSLLSQPDLRKQTDQKRVELIRLSNLIIEHDPEFILKAALYTRNHLNIRITANFLVAYAAFMDPCRIFLKKYYKSIVNLPSDWIEIAELYQTLFDKRIHFGSLPSALRRVMLKKFPDFDKYQLAKYNKEKARLKKAKKAKETSAPTSEGLVSVPTRGGSTRGVPTRGGSARGGSARGGSARGVPTRGGRGTSRGTDRGARTPRPDSESPVKATQEERETRRMAFTLKRLIRQLHISEPVEHVWCLLGKRYPETSDAFYLSRLPGVFDPERAKKRMKLPTPETWETQVSLKGNKAEVWQGLIDKKKLPFMAMLRNLRNMIKAGISEKHHQWVLKKLQDNGAVIHSRQFPFRFFSAYQILDQLEEDFKKWTEAKGITESLEPTVRRVTRKEKGKKKVLTPAEKAKKIASKEMPYDTALLQRYRKALDCSVKIATQHNCQPIPGRTFVFCNLSDSMSQPCQAAKGLGAPRTRAEIGLMLGLMCKSACESSRLIIYKTMDSYAEIEQKSQQTILEQMTKILHENNLQNSTANVCIPKDFLTRMIVEKQWFDNVIIISDGLKSDTPESDFVYQFLQLYRFMVNSELMFVSIDLSISQCSLAKSDRFNNRNDIFLSGFSDAILQFIAERGNDGQLLFVENIDNAHSLNEKATTEKTSQDQDQVLPKSTPLHKVPMTTLVPCWRTVRVFISSTFKDMHAERDLLIRYVFPELRQRAKSLFINLYPTDLRWGIAESQTKQSVLLCLNEVLRSDYIIGLVGERYGYVPASYDVPKEDPRFAWLEKLPIGLSITDLELQAGALNDPQGKRNRAFFYLRDSTFLDDVPKPWSDDFNSENADARIRVNQLKNRIRKSGFETFDGYGCKWEGVLNDRPLVTGLEQFAQRVIDNLWTSLQKEYQPEYVFMDDFESENSQHKQYRLSFIDHFVSRKKMIIDATKAVGLAPIIAIIGQPGSGKTAAMAAIVNNIIQRVDFNGKVYEHYVGITRSSSDSLMMLRRLLTQIVSDHSELTTQFPIDKIRNSDYNDLCQLFPLVFQARKQTSNIIICIDGIESLDNQTLVHTLNFVPKDFNFNYVTFIITANEDSVVEKACKQQSNNVHINISNLELLERTEIVRKHLDRFGKKLDENAFSSQMKYITSKRDSFKPSYLTLLCEELLLMTDYEKQITEKLKSIPQRQNLFLMEIFKRLDSMFGEKYVSIAFGLMYVTKQDLSEQELRDLLNIALSDKSPLPPPEDYKYPFTTTPMQLADFIHNCHVLLKPQLYDGPQTVSMSSDEVRQIAKTRYIRTTEQEKRLYRLLATYYWAEAAGPHWTSMNTKAFEHLPFYLYVADEKDLYYSILSNLKFVAGKSRVGLVQSLIDDYELDKMPVPTIDRKSLFSSSRIKPHSSNSTKKNANEIILLQYRSFIQRNAHILIVYPSLIYQQALNELETSAVFRNMQHIITSGSSESELGKNEQIQAFVRVNKPDNIEQMKYSLEEFSEPTRCLAISPSGNFMAAGSADCLIRLYNTSTSRLIKLFVGHAAPISALSFVGDERLVSGSDDGRLSIWDVANGHRLNMLSPSHNKRVSCICSDQRGTQFASVSWDSFVYIWNAKKASKETEIQLHPKPVSSVAFHPDGFMLVTGCWDGIVRQWNVANGQRRSIMRGHLSSIKAVSYSADGRYIGSCSIDGECRLWNSLTGNQVGLISARISSIYFSPSGSELASAGNDGRVRVFSSTIGQCQMIIKNDGWGHVSSVIFDKSGEFIIAGYHQGSIRIFDVENGSVEAQFNHHQGRIHRLSIGGQTNKILISASNDSKARLFDLRLLGEMTKIQSKSMELQGHTAAVLSCALSKHMIAATGSEDSTVCLYAVGDITDGSCMKSNNILTQHRAPVTGIAFASNGLEMITASRDGYVHIWGISQFSKTDIAILTHSMAHCHADWINDIALSNMNNGILVTASNDNTMKIWDTKASNNQESNSETMETVSSSVQNARSTLCGHNGSVNSVCFSYGCIVSGSLDNTIRVWSQKGTEITCLRGHTEKVTSCDLWVKLKGVKVTQKENENTRSWAESVDEAEAEISKSTHTLDRMLVVSGSDDGSIRVWRPTDPEQRCVYDAHAQPVNSIVLNSESIVTSSLDKTIRSWQIPSEAFSSNNPTGVALTPTVPEPCSHMDEVMSIAVSQDNKFVFTVSRDCSFYVWSLLSAQTDENLMDIGISGNKMSKKPFRIIQSVKAHDEQIIAMGLVVSDDSINVVVTGSVDGTIKFWVVKPTEIEDKCLVKRLKAERTNFGSVSMICNRIDMPYFVIGENASFDSLMIHLYSRSSLERLKTYKTETCQWPLSSTLILNQHQQCILVVGSSNNQLCSYNLSLIDATNQSLLTSFSSKIEENQTIPSDWITSIEAFDDREMFYLGTSNGYLYSTSNLLSKIKNWKKMKISTKESRISSISTLHNELIFTSGYDNLIRVQHRNSRISMEIDDAQTGSENDELQTIGQYPVPTSISYMKTWRKTNSNVSGIVAGDILGNLYLVQWYSS